MQTNTATAAVERPVILRRRRDGAAKAPTARKRATRAGAARPSGTQTSEAMSFGALLVDARSAQRLVLHLGPVLRLTSLRADDRSSVAMTNVFRLHGGADRSPAWGRGRGG
jgi:hypothetical protein